MSAGLRTGLIHRLRRTHQRMQGQHRRIRVLLRDAEAAARTGAPLREPLELLREALRAHFELEDAIYFPALHGLSPGSSRQLEQLSHDHHEFLAELAQLAQGSDASEAVRRFGVALRAHEQRESGLIDALLASDVRPLP